MTTTLEQRSTPTVGSASGTIAERLGVDPGPARIVAFVVVVALVMALGILGFDAVMGAQKWISWLTLAMTGIFIVITHDQLHLSQLGQHPAGDAFAVVGATIMVFCAFGAGWFTGAADHSRYLPRSSSRPGIVGWTTAGGSVPVVLPAGSPGRATCWVRWASAAARGSGRTRRSAW